MIRMPLQTAIAVALALGLAGPVFAADKSDSPKMNPCAAGKSNPCAAKQNPCAAKTKKKGGTAANPCAGKNPCAAKKM